MVNLNYLSCRIISVFSCLVAAGITSSVSAQEQSPDKGSVVVTTKTQLKGLVIEDLSAAIEAFGQYRVDENDPQDGDSEKDTELLFREILELHTEGFIGHPNLLELDLTGKLILEQVDIDSESQTFEQGRDEFLNAFDVNLLFLRESTTPFTIYAKRTESLIDRQFAGQLDNQVTEFGARLQLRSKSFPTQVQIYHREHNQTSQLGLTDFDIKQDTLEWQSQWVISLNQLLTWDYSFDSISESGEQRSNNSFDRHDGILTHTLDFGEENKHRLRSTAHIYEETGNYPLSRLRLDENLLFRHTTNFETGVDYFYDAQDQNGASQVQHQAKAHFRHHLFGSLDTVGEVGASLLEVDESNFDSQQQFATLAIDYTRKIPYGRLHASTSFSMNWQQDGDKGSEFQIIDEQHTFGVADIIFLSRRNIIPGSIRITDAAGIIVYQENADYRIMVFNERAEVRRIVSGNIASGQSVLIDYRIGPEPGGDTVTQGLGAAVRYTIDEGWLNGFSIYTRYFNQSEDRSLRSSVNYPELNIDELIFGLEYNLGALSLLAERQIRDSTLSPFEATRLEARYFKPIGTGVLGLDVQYYDIENTDDDFNASITTFTGRWNQPLTSDLDASLLLIWRMESDNRGSESQGFEQQLDLSWRKRQTTIYAAIRNAFVDSDVNKSTYQSFLLGFRREF